MYSTEPLPNLDDTEFPFKHLDSEALNKRHFLYRLINSQRLVYFGSTILILIKKIGLPFSFILKNNFFDIFCGGRNISECKSSIDQLYNARIGSILDYSIEGVNSNSFHDDVTQEIINTIKLLYIFESPFPEVNFP